MVQVEDPVLPFNHMELLQNCRNKTCQAACLPACLSAPNERMTLISHLRKMSHPPMPPLLVALSWQSSCYVICALGSINTLPLSLIRRPPPYDQFAMAIGVTTRPGCCRKTIQSFGSLSFASWLARAARDRKRDCFIHP